MPSPSRLPAPLITLASGCAAGPRTVPPRWFSKPVSRSVSPGSSGWLTTSPIVRRGCGDVVKSSSVIVLKRSMNSGFAGIDNPLFYLENTQMLFGDAKSSVGEITEELKAL